MIGTAFHQRFYRQAHARRARRPRPTGCSSAAGGFGINAEEHEEPEEDPGPITTPTWPTQLDAYDVNKLINNKPGYGRHGQPVHPNFDQETHVATRAIDVDPLLPVYIGVDSGSNALVPGAVFYQRSYAAPCGQWRGLAEIFLPKGHQMNTEEFALEIRQVYSQRFPNLSRDVGALLCIDPAATTAREDAVSEFTTAAYLQELTGIEAQLAPTNDPKHRRSAIDKLLLASAGPREPKFIVDPRCLGFIGGLAGGYHYQRRGRVVGVAPVKNEYSHVVEAGEYGPLTIDGVDAHEGRFIRPDGSDAYSVPRVIL